MPLSPLDDLLAHQTPDTFDHVYTGDRNFYDRYYFNVHGCSDELFMVTGMGQYPNLGVIDAFACISYGDIHYSVRASRELGNDRLDTSVGPFKVELIEGLQKLRVTCGPNEHGIEFDLVFDGFVPALEEPVTYRRTGNRLTEHTQRFAQVGNYTGFISIDGERIEVTPDRWMGARDHSWGIRPNVGEMEPEGIKSKYRDFETFGHFHNWIPAQFPEYMIKIYFDEDGQGNRMQEEAVKVPRIGSDEPVIHLGSPIPEFTYKSGTREIAKTVIRFAHSDLVLTGTPLRTNYLLGGSGYNPGQPHSLGVYQGPLVVDGQRWDMTDPAQFAEIQGLNEMLCRWQLSNGDIGYGMHENCVFGIYTPFGFDSWEAVAP